MKRIFCLLLFIYGTSFSQTIAFSDANLKNKLILLNLDTNLNGEIEVAETQGVTSLDISNSGISSLSGLENFGQLKSLDCDHNNIATIDATMFPNLTMLDCSYNQLTVLDARPLGKLEYLYARFNKLTSIDVAGLQTLTLLVCDNNRLPQVSLGDLTELILLDISNNELQTIDLTKNSKLNTIYCSFNKLTNIDVRSLLELETLWLNYNENTNAINFLDLRYNAKLRELFFNGWCQSGCSGQDQLYGLEISGLKNIERLYVRNNRLSVLDLSGLPRLDYLSCENNSISELNIKNGRDEQFAYFANNPLTTLCCDDSQIGTIQNMINSNAQNCVANSNCVSLSLPSVACVDAEVKVFPNPVESVLKVSSRNSIESIILIDMQGKVLAEQRDENIDMSRLPKGTYLLKVSTNVGVKIKEVIKK